MKMLEVGFQEEHVEKLTAFPLIRDNIKSLEADFNKMYAKVLQVDLDLEMEDILKIKSDLFQAFCYGAMKATERASCFRINFINPKEFGGMKALNKTTFDGKQETPSGIVY